MARGGVEHVCPLRACVSNVTYITRFLKVGFALSIDMYYGTAESGGQTLEPRKRQQGIGKNNRIYITIMDKETNFGRNRSQRSWERG